MQPAVEIAPPGAGYADWICDDAAPGATVTASPGPAYVMWYQNAHGTCYYTAVFMEFDGFQKKNN